MKKKKEETVKHIKKVYVAPQVTSIPVDHEISLVMMSEPIHLRLNILK
jgi:hypothetical protein